MRRPTKKTNIILLSLGGLLAAMLAGALVAGRRIAKPLNTITKRISDSRGGDLELRLFARADGSGGPWSTDWMRYFMLTQEQILEDHEIDDGTVATGS